ncbi:MAG: galactonate dehydratase [Pseudomonadota bacterium]|jgi:galactonate dehydratase
MTIVRIETFYVPPRWLFVRVETNNGHAGWGEASLEGHAEAVDGSFEALRDRFLGHDEDAIEDIWQIAYRGGFYRGGPVLMSALSGLDQALWDLKGQAHNMPVWQMMGGRVRDKVQAYAWIGGDRPDDIAEAAAARRKQGFSAVKMNATAEMGMIGTPVMLDDVVHRVKAAQSAGVEVGLDFHGRLHRGMAKQLARLVDPLGLLFMEEPVLCENAESLCRLAAQCSTPIALGERLYSRWDFKPFLEKGCVDIIQPDLSHAGGLSECRRTAAMAEAYDVAVAPHCPIGPIALASCLQLAATAPNVVLQETSMGIHYNVGHDLLSFVLNPEALTPVDGFLSIPDGKGLGVLIDEAAVREAHEHRHRWRNPIWRLPDGALAEW